MNLGHQIYHFKELLSGYGKRGFAVDLDDFAYETTAAFIDELKKQFPLPEGVGITVEDAKRYYATNGKPIHFHEIPEAVPFYLALAKSPQFHYEIQVDQNAVNFLDKLDRAWLLGCYATARSEEMRAETLKSLYRDGMPMEPTLLMRDNDIDFKDHIEWKARALDFLYPEIQGALDNDARIGTVLEEIGYKGTFFLFGPGGENYQSDSGIVVPAKDFTDLEKKIKARFEWIERFKN